MTRWVGLVPRLCGDHQDARCLAEVNNNNNNKSCSCSNSRTVSGALHTCTQNRCHAQLITLQPPTTSLVPRPRGLGTRLTHNITHSPSTPTCTTHPALHTQHYSLHCFHNLPMHTANTRHSYAFIIKLRCALAEPLMGTLKISLDWLIIYSKSG